MSFARWSQDGLNADLVAREVAKGIAPLPTGGLRYSGTALFGEPLSLLETGVEFLVPISDTDRTRIIRSALEAALKSERYGQSALIGEINKATRDFVRSPKTGYVVATGLSFGHFEDLTRMEPSGCRLYVRRRFPRRLGEAHEEAKGRSRKHVLGDYPEEASSQGYAPAWVHVRGRSPSEAMDKALEALDLRRAVWNLALNMGSRTFPPPMRGPVNEVLAGPVYSLHLPDGALAAEYDWFDPQYAAPKRSRKLREKWDRVSKYEESIRFVLKRSPYRVTLEDALRRYCRALDSADLSVSFLSLWSLLETLTGIAPNDSHDKVVKRAAFMYSDAEREINEQILHHLRRYRNSYVHAAEGSEQAGAYLQQLRMHTEQLLAFHLRSSRALLSWERSIRFLDLPPDVGDLGRLIETREREAAKATDDARLAEEGIRFREGG